MSRRRVGSSVIDAQAKVDVAVVRDPAESFEILLESS